MLVILCILNLSIVDYIAGPVFFHMTLVDLIINIVQACLLCLLYFNSTVDVRLCCGRRGVDATSFS